MSPSRHAVLRGATEATILAMEAIGEQGSVDTSVVRQVPLPPVEEQIATARFLGTRMARMDFFVNAAQESIVLVRDRRDAMMAAAVTGQLPVELVSQREAR
jgi:hypothetical protein